MPEKKEKRRQSGSKKSQNKKIVKTKPKPKPKVKPKKIVPKLDVSEDSDSDSEHEPTRIVPADEKWKPVPKKGFRERYHVSNYGYVKNVVTGYELKNRLKNDYHYCCLSKNGEGYNFRVHRLVARAFVKNPDRKVNIIVNHLDGDRINNHYKNLEWTTTKGNNQHAATNDLVTKTKRRVSQYDQTGNFIKTFDSLAEARDETGVGDPSIVDVCKGRKELAGGYIWKYTDVNLNEKDIDPAAEGFKQLKTYPNYWVNNRGDVYSKSFKKIMKQNVHKNGCMQIQLTKRGENGKGQVKKTILIHNLVGAYFLKKPKTGKYNCVKHKDGNRKNNDINNLEWQYVGGAPANFDI